MRLGRAEEEVIAFFEENMIVPASADGRGVSSLVFKFEDGTVLVGIRALPEVVVGLLTDEAKMALTAGLRGAQAQ